jgi:hypothetical protein
MRYNYNVYSIFNIYSEQFETHRFVDSCGNYLFSYIAIFKTNSGCQSRAERNSSGTKSFPFTSLLYKPVAYPEFSIFQNAATVTKKLNF